MFLYDGLYEYGEFCFFSFHGRPHSYSNEILRWSKKDLEAYQKSLEDDATSIYHESSPSSPAVEKEPPPTIVEWLFDSPFELDPSSPSNVKEDQLDLVVPGTPEDVIAPRAKLNPKNVFDDSKVDLFSFFRLSSDIWDIILLLVIIDVVYVDLILVFVGILRSSGFCSSEFC